MPSSPPPASRRACRLLPPRPPSTLATGAAHSCCCCCLLPLTIWLLLPLPLRPQGSYRTVHKGYEEVHVPALKPKPFAEGER